MSDSIVLRQFCCLYLEAVPDDTVLIRWSHLISDETLKKLLEHLVHEARRRNITRKLRIDTTVVETNIHYPTDSVRVIARTVKKAKEVIPTLPGTPARDFSRSAERQLLWILKLGRTDKANGCKTSLSIPLRGRHLVKLQETDGGIITDVGILLSPTNDATLLEPSILAADRGFFSDANEQMAIACGVKRVALPAKGRRSEERKAHEMRRCLYRGPAGFTRCVFLGVIASNALFIARQLTTKPSPPRRSLTEKRDRIRRTTPLFKEQFRTRN